MRRCVLACLATLALPGARTAGAQSFLVDLGPVSSLAGPATTPSPDASGNVWNNFSPGQTVRLVDTAGALSASGSPLGISLRGLTSMGTSLFGDEGLLSPDPGALGPLAVASATRDYVFRLSSGGTDIRLALGDLDPARTYSLRLLAASADGLPTAETRIVVTGSGLPRTEAVPTSGNVSVLAVFDDITPDASGEIAIRLEADEGVLMFLNAMRVIAGGVPPVVTFTQQPGAAIADAGGTLVLTASAQSDQPGLTWRWQRDGVTLTDDARVSGATTDTLTIVGATLADAGLYRAVATNGPTEVVSDAAAVAVRWSDTAAADADGSGGLDFFDAIRYLRLFDEVNP